MIQLDFTEKEIREIIEKSHWYSCVYYEFSGILLPEEDAVKTLVRSFMRTVINTFFHSKDSEEALGGDMLEDFALAFSRRGFLTEKKSFVSGWPAYKIGNRYTIMKREGNIEMCPAGQYPGDIVKGSMEEAVDLVEALDAIYDRVTAVVRVKYMEEQKRRKLSDIAQITAMQYLPEGVYLRVAPVSTGEYSVTLSRKKSDVGEIIVDEDGINDMHSVAMKLLNEVKI